MYDDEDITKKCCKCGDELPLHLFYKHKSGKYGRSCMCKECQKASQKAASKEYQRGRAVYDGVKGIKTRLKLSREARRRVEYDSDVIEIMEGNDKQGMTEQDAYNLLGEAVK